MIYLHQPDFQIENTIRGEPLPYQHKNCINYENCVLSVFDDHNTGLFLIFVHIINTVDIASLYHHSKNCALNHLAYIKVAINKLNLFNKYQIITCFFLIIYNKKINNEVI